MTKIRPKTRRKNRFIDQELVDRIDTFLAAHALSHTKFGREVANDSMLVTDIRAGRELRRATRQRIENFLAQPLPTGDAA